MQIIRSAGCAVLILAILLGALPLDSAAQSSPDLSAAKSKSLTSERVGTAPCLNDPADAVKEFFNESRPPFCPSDYGKGVFGAWLTDEAGLPFYQYAIDQERDPSAVYKTSTGTSTDHWHMIGNDRIVATAHNGGYVQLYDWSRGGKVVNRWDPDHRNFSGGFHYIVTNNGSFSTLWKDLPQDAKQERRFGISYFEKITTRGDLRFTERIEAAGNDDPALLSAVTIENKSASALDMTFVEYWDANLHELLFAPISTYGLQSLFDSSRKLLNTLFVTSPSFDVSSQALAVEYRLRIPWMGPAPEEKSDVDYYPQTVFLAVLDPLPADYKSWIVDQDLFYSKGPDGRTLGLEGAADARSFSERAAYHGQAMLAFRYKVRIDAHSSVTRHHLFGYAAAKNIKQIVARYRTPAAPRKINLAEFSVPDAPWLGREIQWHSYYLQAGSVWSDYFGTHFVDQGSAYFYIQGLSGAHRDFALYTLPMVYLRPDLAKEMLRFSMSAQDALTGALPYAHMGHGKSSGAVIHEWSSDLDLFLLLAAAEYLGATRDLAFLKEDLFYDPPSDLTSAPVLRHLRRAFEHLTTKVGLGPHGLIRCGSGDWNDVLIAFSPNPAKTLLSGESALNAGLATVALPSLADALEEADPAFAEELRVFANGQKTALARLFISGHMARGFLGNKDDILGEANLFLDTQPFAVLGGVLDARQTEALFEEVKRQCVDPQPVGALAMVPPMKGPMLDPGSDTNGGTWAAIDSWLTWAWAAHDPSEAWKFFLNTTLAAHAETYPRIWYGIWSGPDSFNAYYHARPGETFLNPFTPMTDFPVMNMNRHSGPLLDAIRLAGIEPRTGALVIDPKLPFQVFALRLPLVGIAYARDRMHGYYRPIVSGTFRFNVKPPAGIGEQNLKLIVNDAPVPVVIKGNGLVEFSVNGDSKSEIRWSLISHDR